MANSIALPRLAGRDFLVLIHIPFLGGEGEQPEV